MGRYMRYCCLHNESRVKNFHDMKITEQDWFKHFTIPRFVRQQWLRCQSYPGTFRLKISSNEPPHFQHCLGVRSMIKQLVFGQDM